MKNSHVVLLVVGAVGMTAGIQEWRMAGLKQSAEQVVTSTALESEIPRRSPVAGAPNEPRRTPIAGDDGTEKQESDGAGFKKSMRKMWDNPAGKSMMSQGVKIAVAMMYEDYVETLNLNDEEATHFRELLGSEMATQQEFGMKLMSATPEERELLTKEMAERKKQADEDIKTFLNNDEDYEAYKSYKDRLPEKQQLEGMRAAMAAKDATMDEGTESNLIEAMHKARTQPGLADFAGDGAFEEMGKEGMMERFEQTWERQQEMLRGEVSFLSEPQKEAFFEYQGQMKEFRMMGLKMAGQMMKEE